MTQAVVQRATVAVLLGVAALWLWSTLAAIANYAFRYPAFDQYRFYQNYLGLDFPASVLQLENGHRPILPAAVRVAEIHALDANQSLQIGLGVGLVLLTLAVIASIAWRGRRSAVAGATGVLAAVLAVAWLGNARVLMHGNEMMHVHSVMAATMLALACVLAANQARPVAWMAAAGALATAATFSFGQGMASFAAVFVLAALLRLPPRAFAVPALMFAGAVVLYFAQLPGEAGVRGSLVIDPLRNAQALMRWLASPWFHAWLGFAEPGFFSWNPGDSALEQGLRGSAQAVARVLGPTWLPAAGMGLGLAGTACYGLAVLRLLRHPAQVSPVQSLGVGLATFALAVGSIICLARLPMFQQVPQQLMADRYLPWACLFWLGLALWWLGQPSAGASRWRRVSAPVAVLLLAVVLLPSQRGWTGWSATMHRNVQQSAVAAQLGIWDAERFPRHEDAPRDDALHSLQLMRRQRVSMFAEPAHALLEAGWRAPQGEASTPAVAHVAAIRPFRDEVSGRDVVAIEGWVSRIEGRPRDPVLVVVDAGGEVRGLAKFSFLGPDKPAARLNVPAKRGFDGYVVEPRPGEALRVLVLDPGTRRVLAQVPFPAVTDR